MLRGCLSIAALVAVASAVPLSGRTESASLSPDAKFQLMALRSGSDIHFAGFNAAKNSIFLDLPSQNASCTCESEDKATFYLRDGGLYLYGDDDTPQQLYADRSGMGKLHQRLAPCLYSCLHLLILSFFCRLLGQGKLGYTTGTEPPPRNAEQTGWVLDEANDLTLDGAGLIACPNSIDGAWSVWVSAGVDQPAGNTGCLGMSARAVEIEDPTSCLYTS